MSSPSSETTLVVLILVSFIYLRGWRGVRGAWVSALPAWRAASFLFGMFLVWGALGSPLVAYDHELLTVHMIQHLLLMTVAPVLLLLGEPLLAFWHGLPRFGKVTLCLLLQRPVVQPFAWMLSLPALRWTVSEFILLGWHLPALLTMSMHSQSSHS